MSDATFSKRLGYVSLSLSMTKAKRAMASIVYDFMLIASTRALAVG